MRKLKVINLELINKKLKRLKNTFKGKTKIICEI